jgi:hypothetical protein
LMLQSLKTHKPELRILTDRDVAQLVVWKQKREADQG